MTKAGGKKGAIPGHLEIDKLMLYPAEQHGRHVKVQPFCPVIRLTTRRI